MLRKNIKLGMLVRPSGNKRSKTRFWALEGYKGKIISQVITYPYIEVEWLPLKTSKGNFDGCVGLMRPVDVEPYSE